ncbi:MAG: vWA domain-containing protein [Microthrixaceae bacterium]
MSAAANQIRRSPLAVRAWWSITVAAMLLGLLSLFFGSPAGAQDKSEESSDGAVVVDRVDSRSDRVVAEGSTTAGPVASITLSSRDKPVQIDSISGIGDGLRNDVVAVIDNTATLGNATVQLAKQGLAPLMPGEGAVATLGVISTGGGASIEAGPSSSAVEVATALAGVHPVGGASHTWQGLSRASSLLADRPDGSVGTVVLFSAAPESLDPVAMSRARSDMLRENIRLDVVALPAGTDLASLSDMVDDLGGSMQVVESDEDLAGGYESVASALSGRFRVTFESPESVNGMVPLTVTSGDVSSAAGLRRGGCPRR